MGLFSDDPQKQALLMLGLGLLGGAPQSRKNFGADLAHAGLMGMQGYNQARVLQQRQLEEEQQRQMRDMQMQQLRRGMDQQGKIDALGPQFMRPGSPQQFAPTDQETPSIPAQPGGMDWRGYANALTGIAPDRGLALQSQLAQMTAKNLQKVGPGESLYDVGENKSVYTAPERAKTPEMGKIREVMQGGNVVQQEWDGTTWKPVGQGPRFKPDEAPRPTIYDSPTGPVWVSPPGRGAPNQPVLGPDGKPIDAKKRDQPLTEAQGTAAFYLGMMTDAEKNLAAIKNFDPSTLKNQTLVAFARGDIPKLPKAVQAGVAGQEAQKYAQGMFQWTEAMLRATTGATAPEPEVWRIAKTYFPMPGEGSEVTAQKAQARKQMQDYMKIKAGSGAAQVDAAQAARDPAGARDKKDDPFGIR